MRSCHGIQQEQKRYPERAILLYWKIDIYDWSRAVGGKEPLQKLSPVSEPQTNITYVFLLGCDNNTILRVEDF